jgi:ABC-type glycerol-3-phosphate transport system substrate-binding protein
MECVLVKPAHVTKKPKGATMNKLFLVLALLFALSACSVGKKCTYTQEGTKISSWVWFYGDKPIDLDKNNCN